MVRVRRTGFDTVQITPDGENDGKYFTVHKGDEGKWVVTQCYRGVFDVETVLSSHSTADDAIAWTKGHIEGTKDELTGALEKHGL